ncbi:MAG: hydroxyphenylacetyl-CoA thioesterase PaaI [Arenicella sp.]|nr:hydroxyphenylacetyl-CoA thioesterase PaaI [Arenicella sp.]
MKPNMNQQEIAEKSSAILHQADKCARTLGIQIVEVSPGGAVVSMTVHADYANGHGYCQGGIITTLADTAFAHACNSHNEMNVAQGLSIEFVRSAKIGERLLATAVEQSNGKRTGVYQVLVTNSDDRIVAIFSGKSFSRNQAIFSD